ncbi:MAG: AbrB/MazE/SpoVT family DNA-binding domain-containing protein [Deltaproteobacteria bacterium]|nr:AbrB/MazE/SpoVT family DNA-binding domain-containing protein [Deltaproteobacteria bacterium]
MKISSKRQISIPKAVMEALGLQTGDEVEFEVEDDKACLIPVKTIKVPRDQAWFWKPDWQVKEKQREEDVSNGRYRDLGKLEDLLKDMHYKH